MLYHHFRGEDAAALEATVDAMFAADVVGEYPMLIGYLVSSAMRSRTDETIQIMATGLTVQGTAHRSSPATTQPVTRDKVVELIRVLLKDEPLRQQHRRAFASERLVYLANLHPQERDVWAGGILEQYLAVMDEAIEASRRPGLTPMKAQSGP